MGIYDREYYRDATRGSGFFTGDASATKTIILINVVVFLFQWLGSPLLIEPFVASSTDIFERFHIWQLVSYAFLHGSLFHILWNMIFLWIVGREMEAMYGKRDFTILYLTAAVFAGLCWAVVDYLSPYGQTAGMLGASGAVMAVVVIYALYYPRREVLLFFLIPVPMWLLVVVFLGGDLLQLFQELQGQRVRNVAFAAHLGGGLYGFLYKHFDLRWSRLSSMIGRARRPKLKLVVPEPRERAPARQSSPSRSGVTGPSTRFPDEHLDAKVDEILAKIARDGRESLTEDEHKILQEASARARDRRGERLR